MSPPRCAWPAGHRADGRPLRCPRGRARAQVRSRGVDLVAGDEHAPPAERSWDAARITAENVPLTSAPTERSWRRLLRSRDHSADHRTDVPGTRDMTDGIVIGSARSAPMRKPGELGRRHRVRRRRPRRRPRMSNSYARSAGACRCSPRRSSRSCWRHRDSGSGGRPGPSGLS